MGADGLLGAPCCSLGARPSRDPCEPASSVAAGMNAVRRGALGVGGVERAVRDNGAEPLSREGPRARWLERRERWPPEPSARAIGGHIATSPAAQRSQRARGALTLRTYSTTIRRSVLT